MADGFGFIEIPLKISDALASELRKPHGFAHSGTVTLRLSGDPEVLTIWFSEPCPCGCHNAIQPGLVPCPECDHSSRTARGSDDA